MSEETKKIELGREGLYDARKLGVPKMLVLGVQHTFAMFGATVLVPILTGISVSTALLFAGIGTLLFHLLTKGKVPAFLGSSFAFLGGYAAVAPLGADGTPSEMLPYAAGGIVVSGLIYVILSALIKVFGVRKIMRFFPPVVTGPIIISIGLILAPSAITNCQSNWLLAFIALAVIVVCNIWGKGMVKILPILIGIVVSYIAALFMGEVDFTAIQQADWFGLAIHTGSMAKFSVSACITIAPIALATMMEHIGDIAAISATCERPYLSDPGLHRTLLGDGLATSLAGFFGAPANTTYGENTGVLALTKVYDPRVMRIAACFAILLSFFPKIGAAIQTVPSRHHRRHLLCAVRHDLFRGCAQRRGEPGGLHKIPQSDHRGRHPGLRAGLQQRGRHHGAAWRILQLYVVRPCHRGHCGHSAQCHSAGQRL